MLLELDEYVDLNAGLRIGATAGVTDAVMVKSAPDAPEASMSGARVRLHDRRTGRTVWQGVSGSDGKYRANGLEAGQAYIPVGIDLTQTYAAVAAGPVVAAASINHVAYIGVPFARHLPQLGPFEPIGLVPGAGSLPSGMTLDGRWLVADWPTGAPGGYSASCALSGAAQGGVVINVELVLLPLELTASVDLGLPVILVPNVAMDTVQFSATGGEGPYAFDVLSGALPHGTLLDEETGAWSGTPDVGGAYEFTVQVTDVRSATRTLVVGGNIGSWTPAEIVTKLWLDAADSSTITLDSGKVSVWADKSGNGNDFAQSVSSKRPGMTTLNSLDALDFDGTDDYLSAGSALLTNAMSMYIVSKPVRESVMGSLIDQYDGSYLNATLCATNLDDDGSVSTGQLLYWSNASTGGAGWSGRIASFDYGSNTFLFGVDHTSAIEGVNLYKNGILQDTGTMSSVDTHPNTKLGNFNDTNFMHGQIAEVIIAANHSTSTRQKVEGYLAHKWGFAGDLDAGHPYKSAPPA